MEGRPARVSGWNYRTLEGHLEIGQMAWEVWKWEDTGAVEFHIHAFSRAAPTDSVLVRLGLRLFAVASSCASTATRAPGCGR